MRSIVPLTLFVLPGCLLLQWPDPGSVGGDNGFELAYEGEDLGELEWSANFTGDYFPKGLAVGADGRIYVTLTRWNRDLRLHIYDPDTLALEDEVDLPDLLDDDGISHPVFTDDGRLWVAGEGTGGSAGVISGFTDGTSWTTAGPYDQGALVSTGDAAWGVDERYRYAGDRLVRHDTSGFTEVIVDEREAEVATPVFLDGWLWVPIQSASTYLLLRMDPASEQYTVIDGQGHPYQGSPDGRLWTTAWGQGNLIARDTQTLEATTYTRVDGDGVPADQREQACELTPVASPQAGLWCLEYHPLDGNEYDGLRLSHAEIDDSAKTVVHRFHNGAELKGRNEHTAIAAIDDSGRLWLVHTIGDGVGWVGGRIGRFTIAADLTP